MAYQILDSKVHYKTYGYREQKKKISLLQYETANV